MRSMIALGALIGIVAFVPSAAGATTSPAENPECPAIAHTIEHWLPTISNRADDYEAAVAVDDYVNQVTLHWLNRWVGEVGGAFDIYSVGGNGAPPMQQGLAHIALLCPDAHAS